MVVKFIDSTETIGQSILNDIISIGFLLACIYLSKGDLVWTIVSIALFILFNICLCVRHSKKSTNVLYSKKDAIDFINSVDWSE
jgi:Kef-type K+ transport system membrane component KefB